MKLLKIKIPEIKPFKRVISPEIRKPTSLEEDRVQQIYKKVEQLIKNQKQINMNSLKNQLLQISIEENK